MGWGRTAPTEWRALWLYSRWWSVEGAFDMVPGLGAFVLAIGLVVPAAAAPRVVTHVSAVRTLGMTEVADIAVDARGDLYVVGTVSRVHPHMVVERIARGGSLRWARTYRLKGDRRDTSGVGVDVGTDGRIYVTGIQRTVLGDPEFPDPAAFLRSYGPRGRLMWHRRYHVTPNWGEVPTAVAAGNGIVVVTGFRTCFECEIADGWIRAWSTDGRVLWHVGFDPARIRRDANDHPQAVALDPASGAIYVVGAVDRDVYDYLAPHDSDVAIRRLTSRGATVWTRVIADRAFDPDRGTSVAVRGNTIVVGASMGVPDPIGGRTRPSPHAWVRAYSPNGRARWTWEHRQIEPYLPVEVATRIGGTVAVAFAEPRPGSSRSRLHVRMLGPRGRSIWRGSTHLAARQLWAEGLVTTTRWVRVAAQGTGPDRGWIVTYRA